MQGLKSIKLNSQISQVASTNYKLIHQIFIFVFFIYTRILKAID